MGKEMGIQIATDIHFSYTHQCPLSLSLNHKYLNQFKTESSLAEF
jgi:hypothetical protein